jgi:hypothetical protein
VAAAAPAYDRRSFLILIHSDTEYATMITAATMYAATM